MPKLCLTYSNVVERGPYVIHREHGEAGVRFTLAHELTGLRLTAEEHDRRRLFASIGMRRFQALLNIKTLTRLKVGA